MLSTKKSPKKISSFFRPVGPNSHRAAISLSAANLTDKQDALKCLKKIVIRHLGNAKFAFTKTMKLYSNKSFITCKAFGAYQKWTINNRKSTRIFHYRKLKSLLQVF